MHPKTDFPPSVTKIKRVVIFVGYACNNNCRFCVAADKRVFGEKTTDEIMNEIREARAKGIGEIVFSGGECTLRKDILDLVRFAKSVNFLNIQIQTNGRRFHSVDFCKQMLLAGMTEFAPALHGHTAKVHDFLTTKDGSFRQTVLGIHNIHKLTKGKMRILANTVITKFNFKYLPQIAQLLLGLGVRQYQFAFVHALGNAKKFHSDIIPEKTQVMPFLKKGLLIGIQKKARVMAEAIPLCLMKDLKEYASEFFIPPTEVRERGFVIEKFEDIRINEGKIKFSQCSACKYDNVCEGPWKEYPSYFGDAEFQPVLN